MADVEQGTVEGGSGLSRRDALKKGAIAGGAVLWVSPFVQSIGISGAFGQTVSPIVNLKDISFIVILFQCGGVTYGVKLEATSPGVFTCEALPPSESSGNVCGLVYTGTPPSGCGLITVNVVSPTQVTVTLTGADCTFLQAFSKCGSPMSSPTPCRPALINAATRTATFLGCP